MTFAVKEKMAGILVLWPWKDIIVQLKCQVYILEVIIIRPSSYPKVEHFHMDYPHFDFVRDWTANIEICFYC